MEGCRRVVATSGAIAVFALAVFCFGVRSHAQEAPGKLIFVDEPMAPYDLGELGGVSQGGVSQEILAQIFGRMGMAFEIQLVPWARALKIVEHGEADGIPLLMKTPEREAYMVYSEPIVEHRELLYYLPERMGVFEWRDYADLKDLTVGLINGYTYGEGFLDALSTGAFRAVYSQDTEANFRLLLAGRIDLILEDETTAGQLLAARPEWSYRIRAMGKPVTSYYWYMGISRLSPLADHVDEVNRVLSDMRDDGSLDVILSNRY